MSTSRHHRSDRARIVERVALGALPCLAMLFVSLTKIGPIVLIFRWSRSSGLHLGDVVMLSLVGPAWFTMLVRMVSRRFHRTPSARPLHRTGSEP
jgi:hypothetical protein